MSGCVMPGSMILVPSKEEFPNGQRIWGTGGWIPPELRRELATMAGRRLYLKEHDGGITLEVESDNAPDPVRPIPIQIRVGDGRIPHAATVSLENTDMVREIQSLGNGIGRIFLPASK